MISLLSASTCFEHCCAHHQEIKRTKFFNRKILQSRGSKISSTLVKRNLPGTETFFRPMVYVVGSFRYIKIKSSFINFLFCVIMSSFSPGFLIFEGGRLITVTAINKYFTLLKESKLLVELPPVCISHRDISEHIQIFVIYRVFTLLPFAAPWSLPPPEDTSLPTPTAPLLPLS